MKTRQQTTKTSIDGESVPDKEGRDDDVVQGKPLSTTTSTSPVDDPHGPVQSTVNECRESEREELTEKELTEKVYVYRYCSRFHNSKYVN